MKLGLLAVLAVAVLVPSLSESRIISRCELREKLSEKLVLPKKYQRFEEIILKAVICNVERRTHLKTDKIRVLGHPRKTTTTTRPVTTKPVTTKPVTTTPVTTTTVTTTPVPTGPVTTKPTTTESAAAEPTTTESMATNPVATNSTSAMRTRSNQTTPEPGNKRKKREADSTSEESDSMNTGGSLEEMLNEEQVKFDEEQLWEDDNRMEDEDSENDENVEDGGERKKRSLLRGKGRGRKWKSWSLGRYGIFELTDSHFCDSGYRWSRNACNASCSAFTDADVSDDCDCVVKTHLWPLLYWNAPRWCHRVSVHKFFKGCD